MDSILVPVPMEFLQTFLGKTAGEITEALKDGEELKPVDEYMPFIKEAFDAKFLQTKSSFKKQGFDHGKKAFLIEKEKELREKFEVEGDTLDEIIDNAVTAATSNSKLNPDDVRNSEVYLTETKRLKKLIQDKDDEINEKVTGFDRVETMRHAKELGARLLEKKKYVLPDDEDIRDEALTNLYSKLEDAETKLKVIDGKIVVLDSKGNPKENDKGTEVQFEDLFDSKAKRYFKVAVADNRQSPGLKPKDTTPVKPEGVPEMKNIEDLYKALNNERDPVKQKAIKAHFDETVGV